MGEVDQALQPTFPAGNKKIDFIWYSRNYLYIHQAADIWHYAAFGISDHDMLKGYAWA
jgi:hypothetical protein